MTAAPHSPSPKKHCIRCGEDKSLDEFHLCKTGTQGRAHWCKACYLRYFEGRNGERKAQIAADREARKKAKAAGRAALAAMMGRI